MRILVKDLKLLFHWATLAVILFYSVFFGFFSPELSGVLSAFYLVGALFYYEHKDGAARLFAGFPNKRMTMVFVRYLEVPIFMIVSYIIASGIAWIRRLVISDIPGLVVPLSGSGWLATVAVTFIFGAIYLPLAYRYPKLAYPLLIGPSAIGGGIIGGLSVHTSEHGDMPISMPNGLMVQWLIFSFSYVLYVVSFVLALRLFKNKEV